MNIHHLELFYFVARHGGISSAVRNMPYGIQQPAVSSQVALLEQDLGTKLFERKPFRLTREGEELYAFVKPFFEGIDTLAQRLRSKSVHLLRLGAAEFVLRDYVPPVVKRLKVRFPDLQLGLRAGFSPEMEQWLFDREIDIAITPWEGRPPDGLNFERIVRRPLALLVHKDSKIRSAAELWQQVQIRTPLIRLPVKETITRIFMQGLKKRAVEWPLAIEASSVDLVMQYVANGDGIGLSVNVAEVVNHPRIRVLPLEDFEPVEIVALWNGEATPLVNAILEEARLMVAARWPEWQCT